MEMEMKMKIMTFAAFTLAEVLITLGIIGVVAALTIPSLLNKAFEREAVSGAKETYSMLAQAVMQWQSDENCIGETSMCPEIYPGTYPPTYPHQAAEIAKQISNHLKVADAIYHPSCAQIASKNWIPSYAYGLDGKKPSPYDTLWPIVAKDDGSQGDCGWGAYILLSNGTVLKIAGIAYNYFFTFDINGTKGPNRLGKDQFTGSLQNSKYKSINPYVFESWNGTLGACNINSNPNCNPSDGFSPLAYVLANDKLPDLAKMGLPTTP